MAVLGHSGSQAPQLMHSSVIIIAICFLPKFAIKYKASGPIFLSGMTLEKRIEAFCQLGDFLSQFRPSGLEINETLSTNDLFLEPFQIQIKRAFESNGWFTAKNVNSAFFEWGILLK